MRLDLTGFKMNVIMQYVFNDECSVSRAADADPESA